jgi:PHD/YefM family antitoxin component YafN of YafNO toxin-antitoxin module
MKVSTADFIKNYGTLADKALIEPVTITKNGRDRLILVAVEEFERLTQRDLRARAFEDEIDRQQANAASLVRRTE